ncbi:hypothetical protein BH23VER1_BH23VER1_32580 [soil metagenome]
MRSTCHGWRTIDPTHSSEFDYTNDDLGRRTDMDYSGTAFTAAAGYDYFYNARGEVAVANFTGAATAANRAYDAIGNRHPESQGHADLATVPGAGDTPGSGTRTDYTADALNQYASITGMSPSYDGDGNLLADGDFAYGWDADNRLVAAGPATVAAGDRRLRFEYDYLGRRVGWVLEDANTAATVGHLLVQWDGWNLVATCLDDATETNELHCTWTWGPDLSGSLQGAGGAGDAKWCCAGASSTNTMLTARSRAKPAWSCRPR